ncbi:thiamine ABC transporter substrate-binding protein [Halopiger xanaduensis]|uniref:ABC transporter, periplasmic binding protein, thiB subfamily n=1 Tax=Halopiger xanaduensis (strain DSM 18323 / JCM 14033 / SH-6) TaxID=797210 RepID=F8DCM0_HALXS|nr:thiamine ABC transporter substrate-binding protein [Halopiger xanaduensis]AEH36064.1 ABC transporter, periplasmic binding protein, thiB subfamily [Halopiger xanaduensis SH-6]
MRRRTLVRGVGAGTGAALTGLAGCLTRDAEEDGQDDGGEELDNSALRIATYTSMVTGERPAGRWLEEAFLEERPDAELDWRVPEAGIEHFIRRGEIDADPGADVYLGLTLGELVRVDEALGGGSELFESLERDRLDRVGRLRDELTVDDPGGRVLPFDTGYLSLVYDERDLESGPPDSFDGLLESEYERALLAQDPRSSDPGLAFLLWTIAAAGEDGYREYWRALRDNGLRLAGSWTDAYRNRYLEGEGSMVVSYSTDRVGAAAAERPLALHQVAMLEDAGYRNTEFAAVFADGARKELAYEFLDFLLSSTAQAEIAARNVQFPAVADASVDLESSFADRAREPERTVTMTYDDLRGSLGDWLSEWEAVWTGESDG